LLGDISEAFFSNPVKSSLHLRPPIVNVGRYFWGDPLNTNRSQLIISDTHKIDRISFFKDVELQRKIRQLIRFACEIHKSDTVLIVTMNSKMARAVLAWREREEIPRVDVTYYRSALSRGIVIDSKHRILILIGGPYLPRIAYLAEAYKTDKLAIFRRSDMRSAFINLIGRVKDPRGQEKSVVYAAGITAREVKAFVMQDDVRPPLIFEFLVKGADALDFELAANSFLHAHELGKEWSSLEQDLPVLARILRVCRYRDKSITLSEILPDKVERVRQFIESHPDVLKKFRIDIVKEARGYRLVPIKS
jgi:hypothetical protein